VLATVVKQKRLNQTATDADWEIAPGAIAWLTSKSETARLRIEGRYAP